MSITTDMNEDILNRITKQLIDHTGRTIFTFDVDANAVVYLSDGFENKYGISREDTLRDPASLIKLVHPEDKEYLLKEYGMLLNGGTRESIEFRIVLPDRGLKWLLATVELFVDQEEGKRYFGGLVDDITTQKDNISTLQRFAAKKNAILEVLSHDLAGPLANIKSLSNLLADRLKGYKNDDIDNILSIIHESSAKGVQLIRDFIDQEFLESTNPGLIKIRMNLVDKIQEVVDEFVEAESLIKKKVKFIPSSKRIYVYIDQGKFMQVINNLISNAIKFTHDGGNITIELIEQEDTVMILVTDDGVGIPVEHQSELFEKFTKARRQGLKGEPTVGLGMSIIKTIVEWHGGRIWFKSKENVGTTFYIELPKK